jgi:putative aldouronate transport system substrate-binding protein
MKTIMKTFVALLLVVTLFLSSVPASVSAQETPIITMLLSGDNNPPEENDVLSELEARLGIKLKVTYVTVDDYSAKLNTLIASNSLPDIFSVKDVKVLTELRDAGMLYNMEPLLAEYGPDILEAVGENLYNPLVNKDGVYGLVSEAGLYLKSLAVRKDWLTNVGLEMPTDTESLYEVLHAFTFKDPDGNGVNDTYGIVTTMTDDATFQHLMSAFDIPLKFNNGTILLEDGTVTTFLKHPRFLDAMNYLRRLYQDGVMDPDFATLTLMQSFEKLWRGNVGMLDFQCVGTTNNWYPNRYTFEVPENPSDLFGFAYINGNGSIKLYPNYQTADAVINANCAHPELAVKLINYMYYNAEGQELTYMGVEGKHFEWVDKELGKYKRLGIYTDDATHRAAGAFVYNGYGGFTRENAETRVMNKTTQDGLNAEWAVALDYPMIVQALETRLEYGAILDDIVKECFAQLIVTTGDVEAEYQEFIARWESEGGLEFEAEASRVYAEENQEK